MSAHPKPEDLHGGWIEKTVLPAIFDQARRTSDEPVAVAMILFGSLAAILQSKGFTADQLAAVLKMNSLLASQAPENLQ